MTTGLIPKTRIFVTNIFIPPYTDPELQVVYPLWLGSPAIQRTNALTPGFAPPALGDQLTGTTLQMNQAPGTVVPFADLQGNFPAGSELIITSMVLSSTPRNLADTTGNHAFVEFVDTTLNFAIALLPVAGGLDYTQGSINFRRDATHAYGLRIQTPTAGLGFSALHLGYTINDADQL
jgi:hypothetical protein